MNAYRIRPVLDAEIDPSHLLVNAADMGIEHSAWRALCRRVIDWRGNAALSDDIYVALNPLGHVKGVMVAQMVQSLLLGRMLDVPLFLTASAGDEDGVISALLEAGRESAKARGCDKMRIWSPGGESWSRVAESVADGLTWQGLMVDLRLNQAGP